MCSSCMCVLNMCFAACSGLGDTHPPIQLETTYACGIINSSSTASLPWICTQVPIFAFVGGFYLNKCSFSIGFFKAAHIVSEFYLNSLWVQQSYGNQSKCWNVQPSCSSHHVECTKTWMRDVSSVCGSFQQSAKPHSYCRLWPETSNRAVVTDDRARCDTREINQSFVLPFGCIQLQNGKRESSSVSLFSIEISRLEQKVELK